MSSGYCSLDDAFAHPGKKKSKEKKYSVPPALPGTPDPMAGIPEPMTGSEESKMAAAGSDNFFPLPGVTARPEEWQAAFTLEPSNIPRVDGSMPVADKSTLWRQAAVAPATVASSDIERRLDLLAKQIEALSTTNPMQSTAEIFLFIAIGLLFLLSIDTLLRFSVARAKPMAKQIKPSMSTKQILRLLAKRLG
jgi:hypothetical protein